MRFENAHSVRFEKWNWLQEVLKSKQPSSPQGAAQGRRAARASAGRLQTGADADGSEITLNASLSAVSSPRRARRLEVLEFLRFVVSTRKASFVARSSSCAFTASSSPFTTDWRACE